MSHIKKSCVVRSGVIAQNHTICEVSKITLDTGASNGNYIGYKVLMRSGMNEKKCTQCTHIARLGDGATELKIHRKIKLDISLYDDYNKLLRVEGLYFYIVENLGDEVIIGLHTILGSLFRYFPYVKPAASGMPVKVMDSTLSLVLVCFETENV
jgi:hypothetical protein